MMKSSHQVRQALKRIISDESLDLYILAVTALIFTILGVSGISSVSDLAAVILALLAALALSQIRSRHHVATIANAQHADPLSLFSAYFPAGLMEQRASAADLLLIGMTMSRTVQGSSRQDLRRVLLRGGRIRVLLLDPANDGLLAQAVSKYGTSLSPQRLKARVLGTLDELTNLRESTGGDLEIRVASFAMTMGINAIDGGRADGILIAQHYEHKPQEEAAPIICLKGKDGFWFTHFLAEAGRMWEDGAPWPPSTPQALARSSRPAFQEAFGAELEECMSQARDLLITGVARNTLLTSNYGKFETWLRNGCRIRFLLIDPSADTAVFYAADRYYAERSPDILRERIRHSLKLLDELQNATGGALSVRLTSYPLAAGIIAVDSTPALRSGTSATFVEYYTYQAADEPKFVITTADGRWYSNLLGEAEALWRNAADYPRSATNG